MQYQKFLKYSSLALLVAVLLGLTGLGPTANNSLLGTYLFFDNVQSVIHLLLAILALAGYLSKNEDIQRYITAAFGVLAITITVFSFYRAGAPLPNAYISNIEIPIESLLYLAWGLWALWVVLMPPGPIFVKEEQQS